MPTPSTRRRLIDGITMFVVTGLSLLLLVYVGYGEGKRTYEQYEIEKLTAQGRIIQNAIESYLRAGLPLSQYVGFNTLAEPIVEIEEIDAIGVYDQSGRQLFQVIDKTHPKLPPPPSAIRQGIRDVALEDGETHYQIALPLRTRFETVGSVLVVSDKKFLAGHLHTSFRPLLYLVAGLAALFALLVALAGPHLVRSRWPWLQIGYAMTFLIMSGALIGTLVHLYSDGAQSRAKAAAFTLSQRLGDVIDFNLRFRDFDGLDRMFGEYRRVNPEISEAALVIDGKILIDTDPAKQGRTWLSNPHDYEFSAGLSRPEQTRKVNVAVSVPTGAVYARVEHSVRNFVALFIASGFLAGLFLQVAVSMQRLSASAAESPIAARGGAGGEWALAVVKPVFFLAVFLDSLTYSFLPKFMQEAAVGSGLSLGFASAPFTAYYLCFALSLIPAGHFAERYGPKPLIWMSLIVAGASILGLSLPLGIGALTVLRGVSGAAQGTLFIGIQAYILAVASPEKKTQGAAIIVFGFQGGMISGMAIGSLLVNFLHPQGVFALSAVIGLATAAYSLLLIPGQVARVPSRQGLGAAIRRVTGDLARVVRSGDFLRTMFCIGVPAKAVLTGVITFALPLLLGQQGYRQEEIGQVIMLYGIGVVAASSYASRLVDRTGKTDVVLFWGAAVSGFGLVLIGLMGSSIGGEWLGTALVVAGVLVVGAAHGLINAPVVTHVAHSQLAEEIGVNPVTTTYRFLERIGHVAGPFLVGQFFLIWGQSAQIVAWIGVAIGLLGFLFVIHHARPRIGAMGPKAAS